MQIYCTDSLLFINSTCVKSVSFPVALWKLSSGLLTAGRRSHTMAECVGNVIPGYPTFQITPMWPIKYHVVFPPIKQMLPVQTHHIINAHRVTGFSTQDKACLSHSQHHLAGNPSLISTTSYYHKGTQGYLSLKITLQPWNRMWTCGLWRNSPAAGPDRNPNKNNQPTPHLHPSPETLGSN